MQWKWIVIFISQYVHAPFKQQRQRKNGDE